MLLLFTLRAVAARADILYVGSAGLDPSVTYLRNPEPQDQRRSVSPHRTIAMSGRKLCAIVHRHLIFRASPDWPQYICKHFRQLI